jgi:Fe-S oxidoreductase
MVLDVTHHTTFIQHLLESGRLTPGRAEAGPMTFHDSCYLGRYNGIYDAPRQTLTALGHRLREMKNTRRNSMCCGGGGGRMWLEEDAQHRLNVARVKEATEVGAGILVTSCPYCLSMLEDGARQLEAELQVRDIAEMVEQALEEEANA